MNRKVIFGRSLKDLLISVGPSLLVFFLAIAVARRYLDPAPPDHLTIATGDHEGDYYYFAKEYQQILKQHGIRLDIRPSAGPVENLKLLEDDNANVNVAFVQDGVGSTTDQPDLESLGSLYYEPLWIFYRGAEMTRVTHLLHKKIGLGHSGQGARLIAMQLLKDNGVDDSNAQILNLGSVAAAQALRKGEIDAAFFIETPDDPLVKSLIEDPNIHLMSLDQADAIARRNPFLHHITLPHGVLDLHRNLPAKDTELVAPTATLLVRDDLHPALVYLLLKAMQEIHSQPGILEHRGEFPVNKDDQFPLSSSAAQFYKSGGPFWQRYLPFWLAAWVDRFFLVVIPVLALVIPMVRTIPRIYQWRIRRRIYHRYGELKYIETQLLGQVEASAIHNYLEQLDAIEDRVNSMKLPLEYTEHIYSLRGHIHFVRERLGRLARLQPA